MPLPSDPSPARVVSPEARRRRREGWIIFATALAVVAFAIFETRLPQSTGTGSLGTDAVLVALINLNIILLVVLVFLVGRNILKLIFERRQHVLQMVPVVAVFTAAPGQAAGEKGIGGGGRFGGGGADEKF